MGFASIVDHAPDIGEHHVIGIGDFAKSGKDWQADGREIGDGRCGHELALSRRAEGVKAAIVHLAHVAQTR
jgi:hypothetical protein